MLKLTLHYGGLDDAQFHNCAGRMDLGYESLAAVATYKGTIFVAGVGEGVPIRLENYPRWSASIWDLLLRAVCVGTRTTETLPVDTTAQARKGAYIQQLCAIVEHHPDGTDARLRRIGTAHILMSRRKGVYSCQLWDDLVGGRDCAQFKHLPERVMPFELLSRGIAWTDYGRSDIPPRPELLLARPLKLRDGAELIPLGRLRNPARNGLRRWMAHQDIAIVDHDELPSGGVTEAVYARFLGTAI